VAQGSAAAALSIPPSGHALIPPPTPVAAADATHIVNTRESPLRLRTEPKISTPVTKNVIGQLPDGHPVRAISGRAVNGFLEVETSLRGAHLRGFASKNFLTAAPAAGMIHIDTPAVTPPTSGIVAVTMPRRRGSVTKRTEIANAHSLNEPRQPGRKGLAPAQLVADLLKIVDWLAVDRAAHKRYQPNHTAGASGASAPQEGQDGTASIYRTGSCWPSLSVTMGHRHCEWRSIASPAPRPAAFVVRHWPRRWSRGPIPRF
jgi:hypothetical protein